MAQSRVNLSVEARQDCSYEKVLCLHFHGNLLFAIKLLGFTVILNTVTVF